MSLLSPVLKPELPGALSPLFELEKFSKIKLIVFDLDGTLLKSPTGTPGERILKLQRSRYLTDARVTVATGRTFAGASKVLEALGEPSQTPVVLYNGSIVLQPENKHLIAQRSIPPHACDRIVRAGLAASAEIFVYQFLDLSNVPDSTQLDWRNFERVSHYGGSIKPAVEFNGMPLLPGTLPTMQPVTAILLLPGADTDIDELTRDIMEVREVSLTSSGGKYLEIRPTGSSKAVGMDDLARSLGISADEVLAVGDNDNDVELLDWAGIGVAVKGSSPLAQQACNFVTRFGAERGAIEVLDLVRRAKRLNPPTKGKNERKR
jgi:Cof subfamily protein (haloacid dehalogenase superfamily)